MIKFFRIIYYMFTGERPHVHEWGKWKDNFSGSSFQTRYCNTCGKKVANISMINPDDLRKTLETLKGVVNSAVHPDIAIRAVMVDLKPIRNEIKRLSEIIQADCLKELKRIQNQSGLDLSKLSDKI